ncbi:MAG: HAMP domain-containing histidine kinase [Candidatus Eremiobacteraeota bacterium]|nr:HAMP domain-containing histidine kinase [Candidatus Eremiobacteraeota bacterium]MBV8366502.1 HAMP domain-containing histidine kinase [Candidatus Eremiobacteraeota bacterium]
MKSSSKPFEVSVTPSAPDRADNIPFFQSLRWRLSFWYLAGVGVLLFLFAAVVMLGAYRVLFLSAAQRVEGASMALQSYARAGNPLFGSASVVEMLSQEGQLNQFSGPGLYVEAFNPSGARINGSSNLADADLPTTGYRPWHMEGIAPGEWGTARTDLGPVLAHWHIISQNGRPVATIYVAQSLASVNQTLGAFATFLLISFVGAVIVIVLAGVWLTRTAIGPINEMSRAIQDIGGSDLAKRLNWQNRHDELGRLAAQFDDMLARLESAFSRERRFISDASHELKTPLTVINANAQMLERWGERDDQVRHDALAAIRNESAQMARVINSMLMLSKTDTGTALAVEPMNLRAVVNDVAGSLRPRAAEKGLTLETRCDGDAYILGEPGLVRQLVVNLTENAIKFTQSGGVTISAGAQNGHAHVDIADTGSGIDAESLPHIFERFYRADPAHSRAVEGTGLGLAVVRSIVRAHGGDISVKSSVGSGTTISVTLPALTLSSEGDA